MKNILVIDAQGGGIGRQLILALKQRFEDIEITAVGTNSAAVANMLKAGADKAATGENAVIVNSRRADIIVGPIGIVIADAMLGEITPRMAEAVGSSDAVKVLIPFQSCYNVIVGTEGKPVSALIQEAVEEVSVLIDRMR